MKLLIGLVSFAKNVPLFRRRYHSAQGLYGFKPQLAKQVDSKISEEFLKNRNSAPNFYRLATAFREHGHRSAHIDLLSSISNESAELKGEIDPKRYGLDANGSDKFDPKGILYNPNLSGDITISEGIEILKKTYTGHIGYEFMYIENEAEREWFAQKIEQLSEASNNLDNEYRAQIAIEMSKSQNFDLFLASKFPTVKRYGGEGCETLMAFFLELLKSSSRANIDNIILGMAHRGRLNLLTGILKFPPVRMFQKMRGMPEFPPEAKSTGDVLSHLYTSVDLDVDGKNVHFCILPNPSHLEAVNPVAVGKVRAKQQSLGDYDYSGGENSDLSDPSRVLCLQIHGDAAISGQGINQETLGFANCPHFRVGGSLHVITNNQLGFTTPQEIGRSSRYSSDIAKMINAPVIHVNGDYPEEVVKATQLAIDYRQKFHKDIFIDLICFRKHGHNEMDDPTFTNPILYNKIHSRKSIPDAYAEKLIDEGVLTKSRISQEIESHSQFISQEMSKIETYIPPKTYFLDKWSGMSQPDEQVTIWDTGLDVTLLKYIGAKSIEYPHEFNIHPHLMKTFINSRIGKITSGEKIDWATAESLAYGSLLYQGFGIRLSGEDIGRGTFSHRHVMFVDQQSGETHIPLNSIRPDQEKFIEVANSTLSEEAVLSFEYGYSLENPNNLVIWEAQFGDFFNGAQIQIDTMITSGELKWMLQSSIVLLLPHGMDGAGPEHSSCKIERFLQATDSNENGIGDGDHNNFQVVNPTTPSQYFHLLRRQMLRNFRKPLIVIAPKILLRLSEATNTINDFAPGTHFKHILGDESISNPSDIRTLMFVSGKHFYNLRQKRADLKRNDVGIIRIESLCPFPARDIQDEVTKYKNVQKILWCQEEHQNMGAWTFIKPRLENIIGKQVTYCGRGILGAPAVGIGKIHQKEVKQILDDAFA